MSLFELWEANLGNISSDILIPIDLGKDKTESVLWGAGTKEIGRFNDWVSGRTKKFYPDVSELYAFENSMREIREKKITDKDAQKKIWSDWAKAYESLSKEEKDAYKAKYGISI